MSKKIRLVIVDDNKEICDVLKQFFEMVDTIELCSIAYNGADGIQQIKLHKPDVVLLDIIMPEIDGLKVLDEVNKLFPKAERPHIIVVSAIGLEKITNYALSKGASYYIIKPFEVVNLMEVITMLCDNRQTVNTNLLPAPNPTESLDLYVRNFLIKCGIPTNILGYSYLAQAIVFAINHRGNYSVTKDIYEKLAETNNTTPQCVERAMRNATRLAHSNHKDFFTTCFDNPGKCPSNSEFITGVAENIKITLKI